MMPAGQMAPTMPQMTGMQTPQAFPGLVPTQSMFPGMPTAPMTPNGNMATPTPQAQPVQLMNPMDPFKNMPLPGSMAPPANQKKGKNGKK